MNVYVGQARFLTTPGWGEWFYYTVQAETSTEALNHLEAYADKIISDFYDPNTLSEVRLFEPINY